MPWYVNGGSWVVWSASNTYWGRFYEPYCKNKQMFRCPSAVSVDPNGGQGGDDDCRNATYGLNLYVENKNDAQVQNPADKIVCHDAWEQRLDNNGDMFCVQSGQTVNLTQWNSYPDRVWEYWRHNDTSNVLYWDGHVKTLVRVTSIPTSSYTIP